MNDPLRGAVALVTGGARGAGRGMAVELGAAGATVYVTGRSTRAGQSPVNRPETIEDTADLITEAGGRGIAVRCDHLVPSDVAALVKRIEEEQDGRLDVLVDDTWGGGRWIEWKPLWEHDLDNGLRALRNGLETHLITLHEVLPLLVRRGHGLVCEITDGDDIFNAHYRGSMFFDIIKVAIARLGRMLDEELSPHGVTSLSLTPGYLRSEEVLEIRGVTEANWRDAIPNDKWFAVSETPSYIGRAVVALATDPRRTPLGRPITVLRAAGETLRIHRPGRLPTSSQCPVRRRLLRRQERRQPGRLPLTTTSGACLNTCSCPTAMLSSMQARALTPRFHDLLAAQIERLHRGPLR